MSARASVYFAFVPVIGVTGCPRERTKEELSPEDRRLKYVEERYKDVKKGMTEREVSDVLGRLTDDALDLDVRVWLFRDSVVEVHLGTGKGTRLDSESSRVLAAPLISL